jgi:tRNA A-37 threonylcarbamoyl transferase component Bud32
MTDQPAPEPQPASAPGAGAARLFEEAAAEAAARPAPPRPEQLAPHFPELEILELVGVGGMGVVYKARHRRLDRLVALKILPSDLARDPQFADRFAREARTLARLDHPHVVRVHDFGRAGEHFFLLLEFVDGANLRQVMGAGRLTPAEALAIVPQICDALQYAHDQGVVHRDIKPENVLLDARGRVKLADFGLAKLVDRPTGATGITATGQVMGTFQYMAPEQVKTPQDVDHRADIYSLGVVFYEMLTGELPMGRFEPPSQAAGLDDARIDRIVLRTLERERSRRYQRAEEIRTDVVSLSTAAPAHGRSDARHAGAVGEPDAGGPRHAEKAAFVAFGTLFVGWLVYVLIHAVWGGAERESGEAAAREIWKGVAAAAVFTTGVLAGVFAAVRGPRSEPPRSRHKLGVTLTLLNAGCLVALLIATSSEIRSHAPLRSTAVPPHGQQDVVRWSNRAAATGALLETRAALTRIVDRLRADGATLEVLWQEYEPVTADRPTTLEDLRDSYDWGLGPFLLVMNDAERRRLQVVEVHDVHVARREVTVRLDALIYRFKMVRHEDRWVLAVGSVTVGEAGR